jgi:flagellar hook-associated protein FlgK
VRTKGNGLITADLNANIASQYYTIAVTVGVDDGQGGIKNSTITYRVENNRSNLMNARYGATRVTGEGKMVAANSSTPLAKAILVDENGKELPKTNGAYDPGARGYLKIVAASSDAYLAIDSLDSKQEGLPFKVPAVPGTDRGFSHYFELNNFFASNEPSQTGDTLKGSAVALKVEDRIKNNPNLLSVGTLTQSRASTDPAKPANFTYERLIGDNSVIQQLAGVSEARVTFSAAGGLATTAQTFVGYAAEILGYAASDAASTASSRQNVQTLLDGFTERAAAIGGVNLDEELANTVIYQNAYSASARVITVTNELFDALMKTF